MCQSNYPNLALCVISLGLNDCGNQAGQQTSVNSPISSETIGTQVISVFPETVPLSHTHNMVNDILYTYFAHKFLGKVRTLWKFSRNSNLSRYLGLKHYNNEEIYPPTT